VTKLPTQEEVREAVEFMIHHAYGHDFVNVPDCDRHAATLRALVEAYERAETVVSSGFSSGFRWGPLMKGSVIIPPLETES
jgi:hypothetical protein